ncbi:hypothetical protein BBJ28_00015437 [Nothophytophthora sp. Chile5]|nr:hypothetical protein BBJ28_00015437 [Nothophytophthora sp. Chile5]
MASLETSASADDVARVAEELRRDFEGACVLIASDLASSGDPTLLLDVLTKLVGHASDARSSSSSDHSLAELAERVDTEFLPQVVQLLLGKAFDLIAVERVNRFLQWVLRIIARRLQQGDVSRLSCLTRILDAHRCFYLYHDIKDDSDLSPNEEEDDGGDEEQGKSQPPACYSDRQSLQFAVDSEYTPRYFLRNLEFWGRLGGFSLFLTVLGAGIGFESNSMRTSGAEISFEALQSVLRVLYAVKDHARPSFLARYFPLLADAVCVFVRDLPATEFYALPRDSLLEVVQLMELLLVKIQHDLEASETDPNQQETPETEQENDGDLDGNRTPARELCEQRVQILQLELSLRFFQSSSLEKRLYGLTEMVVTITRLYNDQIQEQAEPTAESLYATLSYLVDWMHEKQLMQELLGQKMHVELIKRSTSLFQFASELECLPTEWLDLVWSWYHADCSPDDDQTLAPQSQRPVQQRHEASLAAIHDLLLELVEFMELPLLSHLLRRIEAVQANLDANQLGLLAAIAARRLLVEEANGPIASSEDRALTPSIPSRRSLRQRILMHLWTVVLPVVKSEDFRDQVLLRMHDMLRQEATIAVEEEDEDEADDSSSRPRSSAIVDEFLRLCLASISQRENLLISLKFVAQLALLVSEMDLIVLTPLSSNKSYVQVLLDEIEAYRREVRLRLQPSDWLSMADETRAKLPSLITHLDEIKVRLLALRASWMLDVQADAAEQERATFSTEQMDLVWQRLIVDAFLLDEAALCFQWIELCMNTPLPVNRASLEPRDASQMLMPLSIATYLLTTKFRTLSGSNITLSTLCCFHNLFRRVNLLAGGLEVFTQGITAIGTTDLLVLASPTGSRSSEADKEETVDLVTGRSLVGLDELWHLAISATDSAVAEEIITLLAGFYLAVMPGLRRTELPLQYKLRFLEKCMAFLATAKSKAEQYRQRLPSAADDEAKAVRLEAEVAVVNRCLDLLRYFLEACTSEGGLPEIPVDETLKETLEDEATYSGEAGDARQEAFQLENLEERLPFLEIFPSPMKEQLQANPAKLGFRATRRPSWTFKQQHALLDVIVDANEDGEETEQATDSETPSRRTSALLPLSVDNASTTQRSVTQGSPLREDPDADFLKPGASVKASMRSPTLRVRANLHWPQENSPQRGPDLSPEDINRALTDFASRSSQARSEEAEPADHPPLAAVDDQAVKRKSRYGIASQILANQGSHFQILLELIDWSETTSQRTWDLLCRLPTNNELLRKMIRLRPVPADGETGAAVDVDWSDLLDTSNIHRLLYALRLVEALLMPIETGVNDNQELDCGRRQWRERFIRLGGSRHLYETLLKWPEEHALGLPRSSQYTQNLSATCLAAVIRTLTYFLRLQQPKICYDKLSAFDLRLQCSTLPEFVKAIDLSSMLKVAVQITAALCTSGGLASFSVEAAEAVTSGAQLSCSLLVMAPELAEKVFSGKDESSSMQSWLKTLLFDCPSGSTRSQLLEALVDLATSSSTPSRISTSWTFFESLVVSACELVVNVTSGEVPEETVEQLFAFSHLLLERCNHLRSLESSHSGEEASDAAIVAALITRRVPDQLVASLYRTVCQHRTAASASAIAAPRSQHEGLLGGRLRLLALLAGTFDDLRLAIRRCKPKLECPKSRNSDWLVSFVLEDLLFGDQSSTTNSIKSPVCKSSATRSLAQSLLLNLTFPQVSSQAAVSNDTPQESEATEAVASMLEYQRDFQARVLETVNLSGRPWNYTPADSLQDASERIQHAGLENPGCICYMNALVQQLFMMPVFCDGLLALDCSQTAAVSSSSSWGEEVTQLQRLFASLMYTNYRSFDPTAFALSHKDMDGNPTDVRQQMDADEFFSLLLDRVEMFIHPQATVSDTTADSNASQEFMERCFGGVLVNQVLTQQGHLSEREEKFFALSLEVSKKRHLTESLALYVQGESLEGENAYFCEREQQKVSATKRICIKRLPQTLVCHLKRFEFDFYTMEKMKLNDFLEFPTELDMYPYTSEALKAADGTEATANDCSIMYDLVGVVVHSGTADMGHYYSFIKDRRSGSEAQRWLEFNDEVVREFDGETMADECFGGEEVVQKWEAAQRSCVSTVQMKRRSAYMLIYEQRVDATAASSQESEATKALEETRQSASVQALVGQIIQDNARFENVVAAFDSTYERFIHALVDHIASSSTPCATASARQVYQSACEYLFGVTSLRNSSSVAPVEGSSIERSSHRKVIDRIVEWLADYGNSVDGTLGEDQVLFSQWILVQVVALPVSSPSSRVERQRTWLFDLLFLSSETPDLVDCCFQVLSAAVAVLLRRAAAVDDAEDVEKSLVAFFREVLEVFYYPRDEDLDVQDAASGGAVTLSTSTRAQAMERLGLFLTECVRSSSPTSQELMRRVLLDKLQLLDRFLLTLQAACDERDALPSAASVSSSETSQSSRSIAPLAIESSTTSTYRDRLRFCTFHSETELLAHLGLPPLPPVDTTLLLTHVSLKNVILLGLEVLLAPVLLHIAFGSEKAVASSRSDRLVSLLLGVLEELKATHSEKLLTVFTRLLDAEEERVESPDSSNELSRSNWSVHRQVFSPLRGLLEAAGYYKSHRGLDEYAFVLLEFAVHRASASRVLQTLLRADAEFRDHVDWIPDWLLQYLDADGAIREKLKQQDEDDDEEPADEKMQLIREIQTLFGQAEKAVGPRADAGELKVDEGEQEAQQRSLSSSSLSSATAADDVLLEALRLDENQDESVENGRSADKQAWGLEGESAVDRRKGKKSVGESRPEDEGAETEGQPGPQGWKSREDLVLLLRLDLDAMHNNAREA